jgi:hypothetical protein
VSVRGTLAELRELVRLHSWLRVGWGARDPDFRSPRCCSVTPADGRGGVVCSAQHLRMLEFAGGVRLVRNCSMVGRVTAIQRRAMLPESTTEGTPRPMLWWADG